MNTLLLGTRGSALALAQVDLTRTALATAWPALQLEQKVFVTRGDRKLDLSVALAGEAGRKGLFTKELEDALLAGTIDVAVHSLKDLPGHNSPGLHICAVLERASTADVLVTTGATSLSALPACARIGTSSVRRARQLRWLRPDLQIEDWRGNVPSRLRKLARDRDIAGIVLAQAGLDRLGYPRVAGKLKFEDVEFGAVSLEDQVLPAIGQGAIALQSRSDRADVNAVVMAINHVPTFTCIRAEREIQRLLAGDCALPIGVRARLDGATLRLSAILFGPESEPPTWAEVAGPAISPEAVAAEVFAHLGCSSL